MITSQFSDFLGPIIALFPAANRIELEVDNPLSGASKIYQGLVPLVLQGAWYLRCRLSHSWYPSAQLCLPSREQVEKNVLLCHTAQSMEMVLPDGAVNHCPCLS